MDTPINKDLTNFVINKQFKLTKKLGAGAFGEIYAALRGKDEFAMKLERTTCKFPQVFFEAKLYSYLQGDSKEDKGIPKVLTSGTEGEFNYMVMDLLGKSLEDLFSNCGRKLSLKSVLMLADQMVTRVEFIHTKSFIHRDIKPDNFLMGIGNTNYKLYLVDFGLAKRYQTKDGHIPYKENKSLTGTVRYASINTHLGVEQSRRDDLEGLGYVLVYLAKGVLPWMNLKITNQNDKYKQIMDKKMQTTADQLCKGLPNEFANYMNYVKGLKFEEKPDYQYLRSLFKDVFKRSNYDLDYRYDWTKPGEKVVPPQQKQMESPLLQPKGSPQLMQKGSPILQNITPLMDPNDSPLHLRQKEKVKPGRKPSPQQQQQQQKVQPAMPQRDRGAQSVKGVKEPVKKPEAKPVMAKRPSSSKPLPRQPSAKKLLETKPEVKPQTAAAAFQKAVMAPRIVINKEPYQKF